MKNLIVALVLGGVLGAGLVGVNVKAQASFVGTVGSLCGAVHDMQFSLVPSAVERNIADLQWWQQGFVDGALAARGQASMESKAMIEARFASFCAGVGPRREMTMREVGMEIIKDMKTATLAR